MLVQPGRVEPGDEVADRVVRPVLVPRELGCGVDGVPQLGEDREQVGGEGVGCVRGGGRHGRIVAGSGADRHSCPACGD